MFRGYSSIVCQSAYLLVLSCICYLHALSVLTTLVHICHPPSPPLYRDLEWMVRLGQSSLGSSEHSFPLLKSHGDKILGIWCHELGRGAIMRSVRSHALNLKSTLSIPLGHPTRCRNVVRRFLDLGLISINFFQPNKTVLLIFTRNYTICQIGPIRPLFRFGHPRD